MLVGHNPAIHDLAIMLAGKGAPRSLAEKLPTGALVSLSLRAASWGALGPGTAEIIRIVVPRGSDPVAWGPVPHRLNRWRVATGGGMATPIGFEPTISTLTGWRVRPGYTTGP